MFDRWYAGTLQAKLARPYVHLIFGARQTRELAKQAYIVCRCPRPMQLHEKVTALPWFCL